MSFTIDDIEQVLQVINDLKEIPDVELHLDIGDMKLSVWKGNIVSRSPLCSSKESTVAFPKQPEQLASPVATAPVKTEAPVAAEAPVEEVPAAAQGSEAIPEGLVAIKAPFTGLFYRKPSPPEPPFVEVGSEVKEDTTICLVEVMKCFTSIAAGVKGRVEKILVENANLVEIGQVMFLIRPS